MSPVCAFHFRRPFEHCLRTVFKVLEIKTRMHLQDVLDIVVKLLSFPRSEREVGDKARRHRRWLMCGW